MKGAAITYTADQLAWVNACCDLPRKEMHALFVQVFARQDVQVQHIVGLCKRKGWHAGPESRRRNAGKSLIFTQDQVAWLYANASLPRNQVEAAFCSAFPGTTIRRSQIVAWRKNHKVTTGRTGRFEKGNVSANKGRKGFVAPGCEKGWFSKGATPHTARPIGYESINKNGYVLVCVDRPNPYRPQMRTHMAFKHKELWEAQHGPVPKGHALKCLDGDKTNCDPTNWEVIPLGLLPRLNGRCGRDYDTAPAELKPTILAIAKLEHKARELKGAKG
jgi:HNH endonuclease